MDRPEPVVLIDSNTRRRASISYALASAAIHVEPFESVDELAHAWPRAGTFLVQDEGSAISGTVDAMAMRGERFPIIAFGETPSTERIVEAILEGALDYLPWPITSDEMRVTLRRAAARDQTIGSARLREAVARTRIEQLTRRERQVLGGVASGLSNRLIGEKLSISPRTVEVHRASMLGKLGARHSSEAIRIAIEAGMTL